MKSDRLLSLLLLLQTRGQVPASELARRLEVSVRTILRDVEALSAAGVPVYSERGRHGGIALLPGFRTDVTGLTADEARALFVLVSDQAHADLGLGPAMGSALRKVMAALPTPFQGDADLVSRRILIDPVRWRGVHRESNVDLGVLQAAVFGDRRLRLRYRHGRNAEVRSYTVDPYGLVSKAGVWYLVADHRVEPKMFRVDRMLAASVLDEDVRRRPGVELQALWDELRERFAAVPDPVAVRVKIQRTMLPRVLLVHDREIVTPQPLAEPGGSTDTTDIDVPAGPADPADSGADSSSSVELEMSFRSLASAEQLLVFGPAVEVLEPAELRERIVERAQQTAAVYLQR